MMYVYTVYDRVAEQAGPLMEAINDKVAVRAYKQLIAGQHLEPSEYNLVRLGMYDRDSMSLNGTEQTVITDMQLLDGDKEE